MEIARESNSSMGSGPIKYRWMIVASWLAILAVALGIATLVAVQQFLAPRSEELTTSELMGVNIAARILLATKAKEDQALEQIQSFAEGPLEQRYAYVILLNEFSGSDKAVRELRALDQAVKQERQRRQLEGRGKEFPTADQRQIRRALAGLLKQYHTGNYDASALREEDRQILQERLGWVGELALYPKQSPDQESRRRLEQQAFQSLMMLGIFVVFSLLMVMVGLLALLIVAGFAIAGKLQSHFSESTDYGFVYLETFALWLVLFVGLQLLVESVTRAFGHRDWSLMYQVTAFFVSLVTLVWPMIRGVPFQSLRQDIGWKVRDPIQEVLLGLLSYAALVIPMIAGVAVAVLISVVISMFVQTQPFESSSPVGHPITEEITSGHPWNLVFVVIAMCLAAPIVEETMFRGVLYRYLRDTSSRTVSRAASIGLSTVISGLIFAMIHPQGVIGIPILMTLAIGFAFVREWRDSLVAPIVMHAVNNGVVTVIMFFLMW